MRWIPGVGGKRRQWIIDNTTIPREGENEKESEDKLGIVRSVLLRGERFVGGIIEGQGGLVRP